MKKLVIVVLLCSLTALFISCGGGSSTSPDDGKNETKTYAVTGSILTDKGAGISGVTVILSGQSAKPTQPVLKGAIRFQTSRTALTR